MRLATFVMVFLLAPVGRASADQLGVLLSHKEPERAVYPPLDRLTYKPIPISNPRAAAAFAEAQRYHRLSDQVPRQVDLQRCVHHVDEQLQQLWASARAAFIHLLEAQRRYALVMNMGDARYAMSAAEQIGRLYASIETRYSGDEILDCLETSGVQLRDQHLYLFEERALEAFHYCDQVAQRLYHRESTCQDWLRQRDYRFDGTPIELTGMQRYERSDWARNGLSHIAETRSQAMP